MKDMKCLLRESSYDTIVDVSSLIDYVMDIYIYIYIYIYLYMG